MHQPAPTLLEKNQVEIKKKSIILLNHLPITTKLLFKIQTALTIIPIKLHSTKCHEHFFLSWKVLQQENVFNIRYHRSSLFKALVLCCSIPLWTPWDGTHKTYLLQGQSMQTLTALSTERHLGVPVFSVFTTILTIPNPLLLKSILHASREQASGHKVRKITKKHTTIWQQAHQPYQLTPSKVLIKLYSFLCKDEPDSRLPKIKLRFQV